MCKWRHASIIPTFTGGWLATSEFQKTLLPGTSPVMNSIAMHIRKTRAGTKTIPKSPPSMRSPLIGPYHGPDIFDTYSGERLKKIMELRELITALQNHPLLL